MTRYGIEREPVVPDSRDEAVSKILRLYRVKAEDSGALPLDRYDLLYLANGTSFVIPRGTGGDSPGAGAVP